MTRPADWRWVTALIVALGVIVAGAITVAYWPAAPSTPPETVATAPAPLPPATGIDGEGVTPGLDPSQVQPDGLPADPELLPDSVAVVPDPGLPVVPAPVPTGPTSVAVEVPTEDIGVGGEIYVSSPAFKGKQRLSAGFYYPSGSLHGAWDVGVYTGTNLFAATDGVIVGKRDGVPNNRPGYNPGSGSASNWVMLCKDSKVLYYQHMSPGVKVKRGQKVVRGKTLIGKSGNSGNSTGPHLHLSASTSPWACNKITQARADALRYRYLSQPSARLFAPSKFWAKPKAKPVLDASVVRAACKANRPAPNLRYARKALGLSATRDMCGPGFRKRYATFQRSLGYRGAAADGIPGKASLTALGKRGNFRVVA